MLRDVIREEIEDTNGAIRIRISKKKRQQKNSKGQTTIYKT